MSDQPLYFVIGTASGGTSCVAGILHHLGVDMGRVGAGGGTRGYPTYEDQDADEFKLLRSPGAYPIDEFIFDLDGYIKYRRATARAKHIGCKLTSGAIFTYRDKPELMRQLRIIRVTRPLEHSLISEVDRVRRRTTGREVSDHDLAERVSLVTRGWWATHEVCKLIEPLVTIDFYELLQRPPAHVLQLADCIGPELRQNVAPAVASVNPDMRNRLTRGAA